MKKILIILVLAFALAPAHAQFVHKIKADSVLITNDSCTAELNLENSTRHVNGFLYNKGNGRTEFRKALKLNDSTLIFGDTFTIQGAGKNFANTDLTFTGDRVHDLFGKELTMKSEGLSLFGSEFHQAVDQITIMGYFDPANKWGRFGTITADALENLIMSYDNTYHNSISSIGNSPGTTWIRSRSLLVPSHYNEIYIDTAVIEFNAYSDSVYRFYPLRIAYDSNTYKPAAFNSSGDLVKLNSWPGGANFANTDLTLTGSRTHSITGSDQLKIRGSRSDCTGCPISTEFVQDVGHFDLRAYETDSTKFDDFNNIFIDNLIMRIESKYRPRKTRSLLSISPQSIEIGTNSTVTGNISEMWTDTLGVYFHNNQGNYEWYSLTSSSDTSTYKPLAANSAGKMVKLNNWSGGNVTLQQVVNNSSTLTENETISLADSLKFTSGNVIIDDTLKVNKDESYGTSWNNSLSVPTKNSIYDKIETILTPRVSSTSSSSTITPNALTDDVYAVTALAVNTTIAAPSGTFNDGQIIVLRVKDDGTSRTISWNSIYRGGTDFSLPTATGAGKTMYITFIWNSPDSKLDGVGLSKGY